MTCGAKPRTFALDPGWSCSGEDLAVVMWTNDPESSEPLAPLRMPVVVPNAMLERALSQRGNSVLRPHVRPFAGGDHFHLVVGRPAAGRPEVSTAPVIEGQVSAGQSLTASA